MRAALDTIRRVAASMCTVLVTGESGTGKELLVAALHDASPRAKGPLIAVNCGAIPEALIESELFGHARGAFTGAHAARPGKIAAAEGGTLFLDEIGELPLAMQVKLLRVLQQREYSPVGDDRTMKCDVRIVAATNRDLEAEVAASRFREDLYYRLNVVHVHLPALRERREDIRYLAQHFLKDAVNRLGRSVEGFSEEALAALESYPWPGNIRALENAIERAVLFATRSLIDVDNLPPRIREHAPPRPPPAQIISSYASRLPDIVRHEETRYAVVAPQAERPAVPPAREATPAREPVAPVPTPTAAKAPNLPENGIDLRAAVEAFENDLIRQALDRTHWNKQHAARLLGINRTTLVEMVKRKRLAEAQDDGFSSAKQQTG